MNFWKKHEKFRLVVIAVMAVLGVVLTIVGWKMTGDLLGLGIMVGGIVCLLVALGVYNAPFATSSKKK